MPRNITIDLDELLSGNPTWNQVVDFWKNEGFDDEQYLVAAIKKHLITSEQRQLLFAMDKSIEEILNGRYGPLEENDISSIFAAWNTKLGYKSFGS